MSLKEWPCQDQPRQKLLAHTSAMLTDAELLALILQNGSRGQTALDLARNLLRDHSQLHQLMIASWPQLSHYAGLGRAKYALLQAVAEIGRRLFIETHVLDQRITSSQAAAYYFTAKLRHVSREVLAGVFLDQDQRILSYQEFFQGTVDQLCIHPREIIKQALQCNATGLILAHNHPCGEAQASQADKEITQRLAAQLELIEITLIDHVIIGQHGYYSFAEQGLLATSFNAQTNR